VVRVKHRYLLIETSAPFDEDSDFGVRAKDMLQKELMLQIGHSLYHTVNPKVISMKSNILTLKCSLHGLSNLIVALAMIKSIDGKSIAFYTIKSSGTLRALNSN
jgi:RNase P/RNase MRP subunit POP5